MRNGCKATLSVKAGATMALKLQYEFLVFLLFAVLVLEYVGRRLRLPPAASFITGGMLLAFLPGVPIVEIDPELIMVVFLPPLLISSAYFTLWRDFRAQLRGILSLAFGAVIFTTGAVGVVLHLLLPDLPWAAGLAIGAVVSPPDGVGAAAVLRKLNLPNRLLSLLEGESLINDATGLVLFGIAVTAAVTGNFSASHAVGWFLWLVVSGAAVGFVIGWVGMAIVRRLGEPELVITATLLLSTASYICAETIGGSGVLSTVASGLVVSWHQHDNVYASTRVRAHSFWTALVFIMESLLFILIGLSLRDVLIRVSDNNNALHENVLPVVAVIVTVIIARFVWIGICAVSVWPRQPTKKAGMLSDIAIIGWSGMRGVVTLAAALAYPADLPGRDLVLLSAFAVIVATVFVQGITLAPLVRWLGVAATEEKRDSTKRKDAVRAQLALGQRSAIEGRKMGNSESATPQSEIFGKSLEHIRQSRTELLRMYRQGEIHDHVLRELEYELDLEEMAIENRLTSAIP
jgi:CPA1 family monovalent cation:H+ antiporter